MMSKCKATIGFSAKPQPEPLIPAHFAVMQDKGVSNAQISFVKTALLQVFMDSDEVYHKKGVFFSISL